MRSWFLRLFEILVVGKGLVLFGKGLVVFITSSNCRLSGKEYNQYAHNKIWGEIFNSFAIISLGFFTA